MVCVRGVPGITGTLGKATSLFDPTQMGSGTHHHVEAAVHWCIRDSVIGAVASEKRPA